MTYTLHPLERLIIFATDDDGRIPIPRGEKNSLAALRKTLAGMKKKGIVHCQQHDVTRGGNPLAVPVKMVRFSLTPLGHTMKSEISHPIGMGTSGSGGATRPSRASRKSAAVNSARRKQTSSGN